MSKAILVSLSQTYETIPAVERGAGSEVLRRATTTSWRINQDAALDVDWVIGAYKNKAVSIYRIDGCGAHNWELGSPGGPNDGRRIIPALAGEEANFQLLNTLTLNGQLYGPVGYGEFDSGASSVTMQAPENAEEVRTS